MGHNSTVYYAREESGGTDHSNSGHFSVFILTKQKEIISKENKILGNFTHNGPYRISSCIEKPKRFVGIRYGSGFDYVFPALWTIQISYSNAFPIILHWRGFDGILGVF